MTSQYANPMQTSELEQQKPSIDALPVALQVGAVLKPTQVALHEAMATALRKVDLTVTSYSTMRNLARSPGISKSDLARKAFVRSQSLTGILADLSAAELITRSSDPEHGRILKTELTAAGLDKLAEADALVVPIIEYMVEGIPEQDQARLVEMLSHCRERLTQPHWA